MPESPTPGHRLKQLAASELALFGRELDKARQGKDSAVHRARKTLQRLRSLLRLGREADPAWFGACDGQLKRLRRRLGRLRDAAVRVEHVEDMLKGDLDAAERARVEAALLRLRDQLGESWSTLPANFWPQMHTGWTRLLAGFERWPLEAVEAAQVETALERARRQVRRALRDALGDTRRGARHDLRRLLRRYGAMRKTAALVLRRRDPLANRLIDVARQLGVEGDLWLTATALQRAGQAPSTRALRSALEKRRRALCRLHDGELLALRRSALGRRPPVPPAKARAAGHAGQAGDIPV
jgi:hypothetical protein